MNTYSKINQITIFYVLFSTIKFNASYNLRINNQINNSKNSDFPEIRTFQNFYFTYNLNLLCQEKQVTAKISRKITEVPKLFKSSPIFHENLYSFNITKPAKTFHKREE